MVARIAEALAASRQSLVAIPADIKDLAVPTRIIVGDQDEWMPLARVRKAESVFTNLCIEKADLKADVVVYEGVRSFPTLRALFKRMLTYASNGPSSPSTLRFD